MGRLGLVVVAADPVGISAARFYDIIPFCFYRSAASPSRLATVIIIKTTRRTMTVVISR